MNPEAEKTTEEMKTGDRHLTDRISAELSEPHV